MFPLAQKNKLSGSLFSVGSKKSNQPSQVFWGKNLSDNNVFTAISRDNKKLITFSCF